MQVHSTIGEKNVNAKLSDTLVISLRKEYREKPFSVKQRAYRLGISTASLDGILRGKRYAHLPFKVNVIRMISNEQISNLRQEYQREPFDIRARSIELGISQPTLRRYLHKDTDGVTVPPADRKGKREASVIKRRIVSLRKEFKERKFCISKRARELGVEISSLNKALHGHTYKNLQE